MCGLLLRIFLLYLLDLIFIPQLPASPVPWGNPTLSDQQFYVRETQDGDYPMLPYYLQDNIGTIENSYASDMDKQPKTFADYFDNLIQSKKQSLHLNNDVEDFSSNTRFWRYLVQRLVDKYERCLPFLLLANDDDEEIHSCQKLSRMMELLTSEPHHTEPLHSKPIMADVPQPHLADSLTSFRDQIEDVPHSVRRLTKRAPWGGHARRDNVLFEILKEMPSSIDQVEYVPLPVRRLTKRAPWGGQARRDDVLIEMLKEKMNTAKRMLHKRYRMNLADSQDDTLENEFIVENGISPDI